MKVKEEWRSWLKTQHSKSEDHGVQSHNFMASRWEEKWKQRQTLFSWALKLLMMVTAAMKLKAVTNLYSILESRDITLLTKVHIVKAMDCPTIMYGCESWTIKKAECLRIDGFELWC